MIKKTISLLLFPLCSYAAFHVSGDARMDSSVTTEEYRKAISGGEPISVEEQEEIATLLPEKETNRFYVKGRVNKGTVSVKKLRNKSEAPFSTLKIEKVKDSVDQKGLELAFGYSWKDWRMELETYFDKNINYQGSPMFAAATLAAHPTLVPNNVTATVKVRNRTVMLNLFYDFKDFILITPYVGWSAGMSLNTSHTTLGNFLNFNQEMSKRTLGLAYGISGGIRYRFLTKFIFDAGYRFSALGRPKFKNFNAFQIQGNSYFSGFAIGVTYLI